MLALEKKKLGLSDNEPTEIMNKAMGKFFKGQIKSNSKANEKQSHELGS